MKSKKGFISMTLVYTFFIVFLFLMLAIISAYKSKNNFLDAINTQITKDIGITKSQKSSLLNKLLVDNVSMSYESIKNKISQPSSANSENGLFYIESNNEFMDIIDENSDGYSSKIYFFRGEVNNNYVLFGKKITRDSNGYINADSIKQLCWKIVRTNENGSIRLAYSGTYDKVGTEETCGTNGTILENTPFDAISNLYTRAEGEEVIFSNARNKIDEWYKQTNFLYSSNLKYTTASPESTPVESLQNSMSDAIFCDDSNMPTASFKCKNEVNRYSLSQYNFGTSTSNTALNYPVGLLTKDDVIFAGGSLNSLNKNFYLNYRKKYWTMSLVTGTNRLYYVNDDGKIISDDTGKTTSEYGLVPVITIKSSITTDSGSGLPNDPYVLGE